MGKRVLIFGERVHNVGYRPFLLGVASSLGIKKFFADNIEIEGKQAVEIFVGEKEEIFLKMIKEKKPEYAIVSEIREEDYDGFIPDIEDYFRFLTGMQLSKIATYGRMMIDEMKRTREELGEKIEGVGRKVDKLAGKIDDLRTDLRSYMDERFRIIEEDIRKIKAKLRMD